MTFDQDKLYLVTFWDHAIGIDRVMKCQVVGWVTKETDISVTFSHWMVRDEDAEICRDNVEHTTLLKQAVIEANHLNL